MIPKPLNEIEWADLEALKDSGREEDDTIEYKASFSGGSDYLAFSGAGLEKAQKGIVREAIAFLNGRGGDIVIGAKEQSNEAPTIGGFVLLENVSATADRLAQSLAVLIEPHQSILGVRAIKLDGTDTGAIVVRAPSSLRAPHRFTRDKECYIRRGRESVPMPMDEVQDLTLRRADMITERMKLLESQFSDISGTLVDRQILNAHRIHIRSCFVPVSKQQIELTDDALNAFRGRDPVLRIGERRDRLDVAFRNLEHQYRPVLRGMSRQGHSERSGSDNDFMYCSKIIRSDGVLRTDFACRTEFPVQGYATPPIGFHSAWLSGYLANTLTSFVGVQRLYPFLGNGILRVLIHCNGNMKLASGDGMWSQSTEWPTGTVAIPDFPIDGPDNLLAAFRQLQTDVASIAGLSRPAIYEMTDE